jgi:hypothetical protein
MSKIYFNTIFPYMENTSEKEREMIVIVSVSIILFIFCLISANWILPKNCYLFSSNTPHPQACHTLGMECHLCDDIVTASAVSTIAGLGVLFFSLPFLVSAIRNLRIRSEEQIKIFD